VKRFTTTASHLLVSCLVVLVIVPLALAGVVILTPFALGRAIATILESRSTLLLLLLLGSCSHPRDLNELPAPCAEVR
jgi:hypothetical protein